MTMTAFDRTMPKIISATEPTRLQSINATRDNLNAVWDALLFTGLCPGWNYSYVIGSGAWSPTKYTPQYRYLKNGNDWARATLTWNASGYVTQAFFEFSDDAGVHWDDRGTVTLNRDGDGVLTTTTWS